jgi:hypothetical protein
VMMYGSRLTERTLTVAKDGALCAVRAFNRFVRGLWGPGCAAFNVPPTS